MCTVVLAAHVVAGQPLVVVANRDEHLDRASSPPLVWRPDHAVRSGDAAPFIAPRDDVAGGTWLGVNRAGVFVGITNRYLGPQDAARASRGSLVADARDVLATVSSGAHVAQLTLGRGLHMITERSFGAGDDSRRRARIEAAWTRLAPPGTELDLQRLSQLLTEHDETDLLAATCIHVPGVRYGTRSSTAIAIDAAGVQTSRMLWAEGPPCTTPFVPVDLAPLNVPWTLPGP